MSGSGCGAINSVIDTVSASAGGASRMLPISAKLLQLKPKLLWLPTRRVKHCVLRSPAWQFWVLPKYWKKKWMNKRIVLFSTS